MSEDKQPREFVNYVDQLSDEEKARINRDLLASGGILHDYDHKQILFPLNLTVKDLVQTMLKANKENL